MVKSFQFTHTFEVPLTDFFQICIQNPKAEEEIHLFRGNQKITITDWMEASPGVQQRICFFLMVDPGGIGESTCMETQKYWFDGAILKLKTQIVPDNPNVGNAFRIESEWVIQKCGDGCSLEIKTEVECKKAVWGVATMVENILANKLTESQEKWCECAQQILQKQKRQEQSPPKRFIPKKSPGFTSRVVVGTENVLKMFQEHPKSQKKDKGSDEEQSVKIVIDAQPSPSYFREDPAEANSQSRKWKIYIFTLLLFLKIIGFLWFFEFV